MGKWVKDHTVEIIASISIFVMAFCVSFAVIKFVKNESNKISEGIVVDKHYSFKVYNGKLFLPERYELEIQGDKDGETVEYWFEVTESEYNSYEIGDYYKR